MSKKNNFTEESLLQMGLIQNQNGTWSKPKTTPQPREIKNPLHRPDGKYPKFEKDKLEDIKSKSDKLVIAWAGKDISLNAWYSSKHWTHRNKQKKEWHNFFKQFLTEPYPYFEQYDITLECNSRLDPSNCITMIKLCEDTLQELGVLKNDTAQFCRGLHIIPVESMKRRSYKITIVGK